MMNNFINYLMTSKNLSLFWNFGSFLGFIMVIQIFSGILLVLGYSNDSFNSFNSIQYINFEMNYGWLFRYIHMNFVSLIFLFILMHFLKGFFWKGYTLKEVWLIGIFILLFLMLESFLGYVLIWSQMSFWACTVITSLLMVIPFFGLKLVLWIWSNFFVSFLTLKLFFFIHFFLPLLLIIFIFFHLMFLHFYLSTSKMNFYTKTDKLTFYPYFWFKDFMNLLIIFIFLVLILFFPFLFNDNEMFLEANYLLSPIHIVPEWYFLFAYDILRSIKNKFFGVFMLIMSIFSFTIFILKPKTQNMKMNNFFCMFFSFNIFFISWLGICLVELPFIFFGMYFSFLYFMILLIIFIF